MIADFVDAFNAKSLPRIRQLYPGITTQQVQEWADLFLHARNLNLQVSVSEVGRTGAARAQAGVAGTLEYVDVNTGNADRRPIAWRAVLTESPGGWRINSLQ